ncbi:MAG: Farnesyl diphosphate synthase [Planctomycetes bacterium ADurb.Bin401]|nr:MAG: Farnesyl diphosphate synthase [Planctomycetes bacterium ADurb.Bin401]
MLKIDIKNELAQKAELVNEKIDFLLAHWTGIPKRLADAIKYVLVAPGKRIRAAIVLLTCELVCGEVNDDALTAAAAIEMVHTYSLVHDDLPAMDDDDFRRGRPSCHKAFDEATAILAGDALLTMAFEIISKDIRTPEKSVEMAQILAMAAGPSGMIAGQMYDMQAENTKQDAQMLELIHINKTAKMFQASVCLGAAAGSANETQKKSLRQFGMNLGLAFQIADDILDIVSDTVTLGKTAGKDAQQGKSTYPALYGLEESRKKAEKMVQAGIESLDAFGDKAGILKSLAFEIIDRTK